MAADTKARLSVSMYDNVGGEGTFLAHAYVDSSQTIADAVTALGGLVTALAPVSTGGVKQATFSIVDTAVAADPGSDADIVSGANFGFLVSGSSSRFGLFVPSFLDSLIGAGGVIDITTGASQTFANYMLAAVLGGHYANAEYTAYNSAKNAFRSSRKLRHRIR